MEKHPQTILKKLSQEQQDWIGKLEELGFKPHLTVMTQASNPVVLLKYGTLVSLKSDYKFNILRSLHELARLVEHNIRTIEELPDELLQVSTTS